MRLRLPRQRAEGADAGANDGSFIVGWQDLEREALQGAHLDHGLKVAAQDWQLEEANVVPGEVEPPWTRKMDEGGGAGGQGAMPEIHKFTTAGVALFGVCEHFFRLHVEK